MDIRKLRSNYEHQIRNGRNKIYISTNIIKQLDPTYTSKEEFVYVDATYMENLISTYEKSHFKDSLKVDVSNTKLVSVDGNNYKFESIQEKER